MSIKSVCFLKMIVFVFFGLMKEWNAARCLLSISELFVTDFWEQLRQFVASCTCLFSIFTLKQWITLSENGSVSSFYACHFVTCIPIQFICRGRKIWVRVIWTRPSSIPDAIKCTALQSCIPSSPVDQSQNYYKFKISNRISQSFFTFFVCLKDNITGKWVEKIASK